MGKEKISVDELLARQSELRSSIRATIKPKGEDHVTVRPVISGGACTCDNEITISKKDIAHLVLTEDVSGCCGEKFVVVEVHFANETVADIFRQLSETAEKSLKRRVASAFAQARRLPPREHTAGDFVADFQACCASCGASPGSMDDLNRCLDRCFLVHIAS